MDFPQLLGGFSTEFSSKADIQSTKNLRLSQLGSAGRNPYVMYMNYGLKVFTTDFGPTKLMCRGMLELNNHVFDVQDDTIYDLLSDGSIAASYGPIMADLTLCSMDASLNSLFVVSAGVLYRINSGAMTAPVLPFAPIAVGVLGGYVVALESGTNRFYFSSDDGVTWPALNFQTVETFPNAAVNLIVDHQELWILGNRNTQAYVVGSNPDAPFDRISSGLIEMGLAAKFALCKLDNSIFWLGRNKDGAGIMWRANGYSPQQVSNPAVEGVWQSYPTMEDATVGTFQLNSSCLRITFPSANDGLGATWEYDVKIGPANGWTECAWWNMAQSRYERHRGNAYCSAFGKILAGDHSNGLVYEMSEDFYSDFGYPIRWELRAPHITKDGKQVQYKRFDLFMQPGVGSNTPLWLNDHSLDFATFSAALGALIIAGTIDAQQELILAYIYLYRPYAQSVALPSTTVMEALGFFDIANDPVMSLRYSNDGGETYTAFFVRKMGQSSNYNQRIYWGGIGGMGMARDRVYEISGMAPVKTAIVQGTFDAQLCQT